MSSDAPPTPLIGRRRELDELEKGYASAAAGDPRFLFLAGETGIGKSRLITEFLAIARDRGALAMFGAAPVLIGQDIPYAPLVGVLRDLKDQLDAAELRRLVPADSELAALLPERGVSPSLPSGDATSQVRLYEQVLALIGELGALRIDAPVVIALEDLHWADASTRDLLAYLLRNMSQGRALVVATYRDTDVGPSHPLQRLMIQAIRQRTVQHVEVSALSEDECNALIASSPSSAVSDEWRTAVLERSAGNPLFIERLLEADPGDAVPASLANLLRDGLAELSKPAHQALRLAAVAGANVPAALLETCAAAIGLDIVDAIGEVRGSQILRMDRHNGSEIYSFRHPLLQEVIYAELGPSERAHLHRVVGEVLGHQFGSGVPDVGWAIELARHWWAAGDRGRALPWLVRAAEATEAVYAFGEAHALYERAIEASGASPGAVPQRRPIGFRAQPEATSEGPDQRRLLERAAQSASLAGRPQRALELIDAAMQASSVDASMLARRAQYLWETGLRFEAVAAYRSAIARLPEGPSVERATVLRNAARTLLLASDYSGARDLAMAALAAARDVDDESAERQAMYTLGASLAHMGDTRGASDMIDRARELEGRQQRQSNVLPRPSRIVDMLAGYWSRATVLSRAGHPDESAAAALEGLRRARELGVEQGWGDVVGAAAVEQLIELGRWEDAHALIDDLLHRTPGLGSPELRAIRSRLLAMNGRFAEGLAELAQAHQATGASVDPRAAALLARAGAELGIGTNQLSEASAALGEALVTLGPESDRQVQAELLGLALRVAADRAQMARSRRLGAETAEVEHQAALLHGQVLALDQPKPATGGETSKLAALVEWASAEHGRATAHAKAGDWQALAVRWHSLQMPHRAAYAEWRAAESMLSSRGSREGRELLVAAHRAALALGAEPLRREVEALARRARVSLGVEVATAPLDATEADRASAPESLGLSVRELEVIALVAEGRTNRQIAESLFITEKTAGHHVSNILAKLGVGSRVEAAAVAIKAGIVGGAVAVAETATERSTGGNFPSPDRLPLTLMFTDMVKSTALLEVIGDEAWASLVAWHDATLRALFAAYAGREIDHAGDGFFVVYPDIVAGLDCAIAVQRTLAQHRRAHGFAPRLRIALHAAEVTRRGAGVQGRGVHEAARIAAAAAGDEILVSSDSLASSDRRYVRLEPRQVQAAGFSELLSVVPIRWQIGTETPPE